MYDSLLEEIAAVDRSGSGTMPPLHALSQLRRFLRLLAIAIIPLCLLCFAKSIADLGTYTGYDLRPKISGARLLAAGLDPYNTQQSSQMSEYFQTNVPPLYSPALLALYIPLSPLPPHVQRVIYFWLDWVVAGLVLYLLRRYFFKTRIEGYLCWCIYAAFLICSYSFRMHLASGQYYMFLLLLTCCAAISLKMNMTSWVSCIPAALLIVLRPTYGLVLVAAFLCLGARKWTVRVAIVAAAMFAMTLYFGGFERWRGFERVVVARQARHLAEYPMVCTAAGVTIMPSGLPKIIEGVDYRGYFPRDSLSGTLIGMATDPALKACRVMPVRFLSPLNSLLMALVLAGGVMLAWIARRRLVSRQLLIGFVMVWPIIFEIFGPERYFYTGVVEVLPLLLILVDRENFRIETMSSLRLFLLAGIAFLGVATPLIFQLLHQHYGNRISVFILVGLPVTLGLYCAYSVAVASKRFEPV